MRRGHAQVGLGDRRQSVTCHQALPVARPQLWSRGPAVKWGPAQPAPDLPGALPVNPENQPCPILLTTWGLKQVPLLPQGERQGWALGKGAVTDPGSVLWNRVLDQSLARPCSSESSGRHSCGILQLGCGLRDHPGEPRPLEVGVGTLQRREPQLGGSRPLSEPLFPYL